MLETTQQRFRPSDPSPEKISILLISSHSEDLGMLRTILHHQGWEIAYCSSAAEAERHLTAAPLSIVVCERELSDGNWKDILRKTEAILHPPLLLVVSRHADEQLWAEVLNLGGYDVLLKPFDRMEVTRVVGMAWRFWHNSNRLAAAKTGAAVLKCA